MRVLQEAIKDREETLESVLYGAGPIIEDFEKKMAAFLGKESAVFFPSGTIDIGLTHYIRERNKTSCYYEVSIGDRYARAPKDRIRQAFPAAGSKNP